MNMGKFPSKVEGYECPDCQEFFEEENDATDCCPKEAEEAERWKCVTCGELHEDKDDAYNCRG